MAHKVISPTIKYRKALREFHDLSFRLYVDVSEALDAVTAEGPDSVVALGYPMRVYTRVVFAYIEAHVYSLKRLALAIGASSTTSLSFGEESLLREESYDAGHDGEVRTRPAFTAFKPNLRFAIATFCKVCEIENPAVYSDAGWKRLQAAVARRNQITHPKRTSDLDFSPEQAEDVTLGFKWFVQTMKALFQAIGQPLPDPLSDFEAWDESAVIDT